MGRPGAYAAALVVRQTPVVRGDGQAPRSQDSRTSGAAPSGQRSLCFDLYESGQEGELRQMHRSGLREAPPLAYELVSAIRPSLSMSLRIASTCPRRDDRIVAFRLCRSADGEPRSQRVSVILPCTAHRAGTCLACWGLALFAQMPLAVRLGEVGSVRRDWSATRRRQKVPDPLSCTLNTYQRSGTRVPSTAVVNRCL